MVNPESDFLLDKNRGVFTIRLGAATELDLSNSDQVFDTVARAAGDAACSSVVFDMGRAAFLDCSTLGALVRAREEAQRLGKTFVLDVTGVTEPPVVRVLGLVNLDDRLLIAR